MVKKSVNGILPIYWPFIFIISIAFSVCSVSGDMIGCDLNNPLADRPLELQARIQARRQAMLDEFDTNDNGQIDAAELERLGARIEVKNGTATIIGVPALQGAPVMATDLRASAALVIAGCAAAGTAVSAAARVLKSPAATAVSTISWLCFP